MLLVVVVGVREVEVHTGVPSVGEWGGGGGCGARGEWWGRGEMLGAKRGGVGQVGRTLLVRGCREPWIWGRLCRRLWTSMEVRVTSSRWLRR